MYEWIIYRSFELYKNTDQSLDTRSQAWTSVNHYINSIINGKIEIIARKLIPLTQYLFNFGRVDFRNLYISFGHKVMKNLLKIKVVTPEIYL